MRVALAPSRSLPRLRSRRWIVGFSVKPAATPATAPASRNAGSVQDPARRRRRAHSRRPNPLPRPWLDHTEADPDRQGEVVCSSTSRRCRVLRLRPRQNGCTADARGAAGDVRRGRRIGRAKGPSERSRHRPRLSDRGRDRVRRTRAVHGIEFEGDVLTRGARGDLTVCGCRAMSASNQEFDT